MNLQTISVDNVKFSVARIGEGFPTIMVHGNRDRKEVLYELANSLQCDLGGEYVLVDLRGHGDSEKVKHGYTIDKFVEDLYGICSALGFSKINYIGHSLGSTIGIRLASKYPTLINRLVLMSAAASFKIGFERPAFSRNEFRHQLEETNQRAYKFFFSADYPEISKKILNNWLNVDFDVHMEMIKLKHPNLTEDARMIQCKTLILTGNKDKATTVEDGKKLSELIEKGKFAVIPGSHYMFLENPNAVEKIIKEFLTNEFKNSDN